MGRILPIRMTRRFIWPLWNISFAFIYAESGKGTYLPYDFTEDMGRRIRGRYTGTSFCNGLHPKKNRTESGKTGVYRDGNRHWIPDAGAWSRKIKIILDDKRGCKSSSKDLHPLFFTPFPHVKKYIESLLKWYVSDTIFFIILLKISNVSLSEIWYNISTYNEKYIGGYNCLIYTQR